MTENPEINEIAKALSDDFRVQIMSALLEGPPKRYSELLHYLEQDNDADSGKLSYHLNILSASGLITKVNDSYRVTEMGCQTYAALVETSDNWDTLVLREDLKQYTTWEVMSLLWSGSLSSIGLIFIIIGITMAFQTGELSYSVLVILGISLYLFSKRINSKDEKEKQETVQNLKTLLGDNRLMPEVINTLGGLSITAFFGIGLLAYTDYIVLDFLLKVLLVECLFGLVVAFWLTKRMNEVWTSYQQGREPVNYKDALSLITSYTLHFNVLFSVIFFVEMFSKKEYMSQIWIPINLLMASYNLFKDTLPVERGTLYRKNP